MPSQTKYNQVWMSIAYQASTLSKDPITKVGALIVSPDNDNFSIGYNGFAKGIEETDEKWQRPIKYEYAIHAEENCIINTPFSTKGCRIYVTIQPCCGCIKKLINAGIKELYYDKPYERIKNIDMWQEHAKMFDIVECMHG